MNSDAPWPKKVLPQADESRSAASTNSYYQLLLQKCGSRRALQPATDPTRRLSVTEREGR
jgi:hypothetical protein